MQKIYKSKDAPGKHTAVDGVQHLDKVIDMDQSPIGRTPRSNAATYTGVFDDIRKLFSTTPEAKVRGYMPGRFSFNVPGGRCEACSGDGTIKIEMHFSMFRVRSARVQDITVTLSTSLSKVRIFQTY